MNHTSAPAISFVVPLFNNVEHSKAMLDSLLASIPGGLAYEIILADDGSTDSTAKWLKSLNVPAIKTLISPVNSGYSKINNRAVALARGRLLALLNNDLLLKPGWLEPMLDTLKSPALNAGIVGNVQLRMDDNRMDHAGVMLTAAAKFEHVRHISPTQTDEYCVLAATGACMLLLREDFIKLGGFDERFRNGGEDIDLCFAIQALGKRVYVNPNSHIRHHVSLSRGKPSLQDEINSRYLFHKWRERIKQQLTACWFDLVNRRSPELEKLVQGQLSKDFLGKPNLAARLIAESVLMREESHWRRLLDTRAETPTQQPQLVAKGLQAVAQGGYRVIGNAVSIQLNACESITNFHVCGQVQGPYTLKMVISINSIQTVSFDLQPAKSFNAGIEHPLLLNTPTNEIELTITALADHQLRESGLTISHLVIGDVPVWTLSA